MSAPTRFTHEDYTVGWICALPLEMIAAKFMLDNVHPKLLLSNYITWFNNTSNIFTDTFSRYPGATVTFGHPGLDTISFSYRRTTMKCLLPSVLIATRSNWS
ncbi:hypothetical protein ETB97_005241 [Aspergillus alliaceus]|uniref:Uncharacterized protein n=1 Tax=Petromyces alliaceus TaxID=209559 RepID=A0A8H5ZYX9_PETAA|nr:hypothetical protein ETB97_005241 [Aspergillus burnettii]